MRVATIRSLIHPKIEGLIITEEGYWEMPVNMDLAEARASGDPKGFMTKTIASHLAAAVKQTGLPLREKLWSVEFSQWAQTNFNLPTGVIA